MRSPHNTNPAILKQAINGLDSGGSSGGIKKIEVSNIVSDECFFFEGVGIHVADFFDLSKAERVLVIYDEDIKSDEDTRSFREIYMYSRSEGTLVDSDRMILMINREQSDAVEYAMIPEEIASVGGIPAGLYRYAVAPESSKIFDLLILYDF